MSNGNRWSKFWWSDWQADPSLRLVSLAAQGLWMRLLCIAHEAEPYGHVLVSGRQPTAKELSEIIGRGTEKAISAALAELERENVFSRTGDGTIYCRRMVKDRAASDAGREHGLKGGNPALNGKGNAPKNPDGGLTPPITPPVNLVNGHDPYPPPLSEPLNQKLEAESEEEREEGSKGERSDSLPSARALAPAPRRPEDWQPSILVIAYAVSLGLSEPEVFQSAEGMRNWHIAHGKRLADYDARFRLWVWDDAKKARRPVRDQNPITTMMQKWGTGSIVMGHYDDDFDQKSNRTQVLL